MNLKWYWLIAGILWLIGSLGTLFSGDYPTVQALKELCSQEYRSANHWNAIFDERLPRWIVLSCSGASIAVAGAAMQALFANPLASASSLGIASGGSLMIIVAYITGLVTLAPFSIPTLAFLGCLGTLSLVFVLFQLRAENTSSLLLIGIAVSTLLGAIESTLLYSIRDDWVLSRTLAEWATASSSGICWDHVFLQLPLCLVGSLGILYFCNEIDILTLGEEQAGTLGVNVPLIRWSLFLFISLITSSTLAALGNLPFFGLLLPHIVRTITGPKHSRLLPLTALVGAGMICSFDWLLRLSHLNVATLGNFCALIGSFGFLILFLKSDEERTL
jgi:iron complex transport system permease protein